MWLVECEDSAKDQNFFSLCLAVLANTVILPSLQLWYVLHLLSTKETILGQESSANLIKKPSK